MVQATEDENDLDLSQALSLFNEMNLSVQHVSAVVNNMIQKVNSGEISTSQGLSFLEMKYHMLLSYLIDLTCVILTKNMGKQIENDPCIDRLVEIRTVLEKIKPIENKLKYQIDKLVKSSVSNDIANNSTGFKPNTSNFVRDSDSSENEDEEQEKSGKTRKPRDDNKSDLYVPPKIAAVHYTDQTVRELNKNSQKKKKKLAVSDAVLDDWKEEHLDIPLERSQTSRAQQNAVKEQREKQDYEEQYLTRLPVTKAEKQMQQHLSTVGTLEDEVLSFGRKRKAPQSKRKSKGKSVKRKRF